jgi:hypothetical protein
MHMALLTNRTHLIFLHRSRAIFLTTVPLAANHYTCVCTLGFRTMTVVMSESLDLLYWPDFSQYISEIVKVFCVRHVYVLILPWLLAPLLRVSVFVSSSVPSHYYY